MAERPGELRDPQTTNTEKTRGEREQEIREDLSTIATATSQVADSDDVSQEVEDIRDNIETTREKMGETIDAIQERLSVSNISEQVKDEVSTQISNAYQSAKETVYDATVVKAGRFMKNVQREVSKLPISGRDIFPMALVGLGVGMFFMNKRRHGNGRSMERSRFYGTGERSYSDRALDADAAYEYGRGGRSREYSDRPSMLKSAQDTMSNVGERVSETGERIYDRVSHTGERIYDNVTSAASTAARKVSDAGHKAVEQYEHQLDENPLAVGIAAAALGAAVGLALPVTRYENELMGDTRNKLVSAAGETTREALNKVENAAEKVTDAITEGGQGTRQTTQGTQGSQGTQQGTQGTQGGQTGTPRTAM